MICFFCQSISSDRLVLKITRSSLVDDDEKQVVVVPFYLDTVELALEKIFFRQECEWVAGGSQMVLVANRYITVNNHLHESTFFRKNFTKRSSYKKYV